MKPAHEKYIPFVPLKMTRRAWPDRELKAPPVWCSVDLRDGNQALIDPMNVREKLELFHTLVDIGVKEIEVGFPSASETEYEFIRTLIEGGHIPDDVTIQVLVQAREHLIRRTFEAIDGAKHVIFHFYNSTSTLQRKVVFHTDVEGVKKIAVDAARLIRELSQPALDAGMDLRYEYSPESFMGTEMDAAVEICQAVFEAIGATPEHKVILNLPTTVENCMPNYFADEIEYFISRLPGRDRAIISLHPHNDRGEGVATAELGLLAGAERVEATLFGNGERTGNVDMVTLALNLYTQGVDPKLDFSDINKIRDVYERVTKMKIGERQPYVGELVFTAFSGSHQDAIKKGFDARQPGDPWQMPYLPIDPQDIGCSYEAVIRVNSQSGKSGSAWLIEQNHGLKLPRGLQQDFSQHVQQATDSDGKEMTHHALWQLFRTRYGLQAQPALTLLDYQSASQQDGQLSLQATLRHHGETRRLQGQGNGLLSAAASGLSALFRQPFMIKDYHEHTLGARSDSRSVAYIRCVFPQGESYWGVGIDNDVARASLQALCNALSAADQAGGRK